MYTPFGKFRSGTAYGVRRVKPGEDKVCFAEFVLTPQFQNTVVMVVSWKKQAKLTHRLLALAADSI
eukprot:869968-Rhodomonas_salina.1